MLVVKASVRPSALEGLGLFADQKIPKGTVIWKFNPLFDIMFDPAEVEKMPEDQQELIHRYAYLSKNTGKYVYSIDNSRFINHSATRANKIEILHPGEIENRSIAIRDIEVGEEILVDYRTIDAADAESSEVYLDT
jgi:SET domain-containing protein